MNKNLIIGGIVVVVVIAGFGLWYVFSGHDVMNSRGTDTIPTVPTSQNQEPQNQPGQTQVEPGVTEAPGSVPPASTYTYPWWIPFHPTETETPSTQSPATVPTQYSQPALVKKDFQNQKGTFSDTVSPGDTTIVGTYALQDWGDENTSGVALMKFSSQSKWILVDGGGGAPTLEWLMSFGVSRSIAEKLLSEAGYSF